MSREYVIKQGWAYLIEVERVNQDSFPWTREVRHFVEHDNDVLSDTLESCKFTVKRQKALSRNELQRKINKIHEDVSKAEEGTCDALIIVISGYGDEGLVFCNGGDIAIYDLLWGTFKGDNCKELAGKPKLFLLQTCNHLLYPFRGEIQSDGPTRIPPRHAIQMIPAEADFAFAQCLIPGTTPWRNRKDIRGSMFITSFCKHINGRDANNGITLNQVMTRTRRDIDDEMTNESEAIYEKTQRKLPLMSTTLTKTFRFSGK